MYMRYVKNTNMRKSIR